MCSACKSAHLCPWVPLQCLVSATMALVMSTALSAVLYMAEVRLRSSLPMHCGTLSVCLKHALASMLLVMIYNC